MRATLPLLISSLIIVAASLQNDPVAAVEGLMFRLIPREASNFQLEVTDSASDACVINIYVWNWILQGSDIFSISDGNGGKIILSGNNGVSLASALNW